MSMKLLGNHFDIHTGGEDLSRVHHANEIAQSEPITGAPWVNTWLHYSFLLDKSGEKMAKSKGEFLGMDALRNVVTTRWFIVILSPWDIINRNWHFLGKPWMQRQMDI